MEFILSNQKRASQKKYLKPCIITLTKKDVQNSIKAAARSWCMGGDAR